MTSWCYHHFDAVLITLGIFAFLLSGAIGIVVTLRWSRHPQSDDPNERP